MISILTSKYRLSKRLASAWFKDIYQMPICLGSVSNIEQTISEALATIHQDLARCIQLEKVVHADETGHLEKIEFILPEKTKTPKERNDALVKNRRILRS